MHAAAHWKVDVRRSADRGRSVGHGVQTRHSFAFGGHYDPANTGFGLLQANNEEWLRPGAGYAPHTHRDVEIVTWVVSGVLRHEDSLGNRIDIISGQVACLGAGSGVWHSEHNPSSAQGMLHFIQMWVTPVRGGLPATFAVSPAPDLVRTPAAKSARFQARTGLVTLASGLPGQQSSATVPLRQPGAVLRLASLQVDAEVVLPDAPFVHVFVLGGPVELADVGRLDPGDAVRLSGRTARVVRALAPTVSVTSPQMPGQPPRPPEAPEPSEPLEPLEPPEPPESDDPLDPVSPPPASADALDRVVPAPAPGPSSGTSRRRSSGVPVSARLLVWQMDAA